MKRTNKHETQVLVRLSDGPAEVKTHEIYAGVVPLLAIQVMVLALLWSFPAIVTWLPRAVYGE